MRRSLLAATATLGVTATLVACPGTLQDPARFDACPDVPTVTFAKTCLGSGCHNAKDLAGNLDLQSDGLAARLVGHKTSDGVSMLIDPSAPEKSAIYTKLSSPMFGSRMPLGQPALSTATQACVLDWVRSLTGPGDAGGDSSADVVVPTSDAGDASVDPLSTDKTQFGLGGPSRCATANVQLCEDFETGMLDTKTWTVSGTAPKLDGVQTARGKFALHIQQTGNGQSYIRETKTFDGTPRKYYGRAFVYFATLAGPPMTYAHWTFIAASGNNVSGEIRLSGQFQNGKNLFGVGTDNRVDDAGTGDWTTSDTDFNKAPTPVPAGQWLCIEWMHDSIANETRFYWDAVEHPSLHTTASMHGGNTNPYMLPNFTNVWLGWQEYQPSTLPFEMWVDEVAIDPARIGCVR